MLSDTGSIVVNNDNLWSHIDSFNTHTISIKQDKTKCVHCLGNNLVNDYSKGCIKCLDCGICSSQIYDENPEWSQYEDGKGEGSMRCGSATNFFLPKSSLGTTIGGKGYSILKMLQNWNQMPYKERSLSEILQYIERVCRKKLLPKAAIDNVKILYKQIHDLKYDTEEKKNKNIIIRGENRKGIFGAAVYYGSQLQGYARSIKEIAVMFETSIKTITKGCRKFVDLMKKNNLINTITITSPNDFIERFCYKLKLKKDEIDIILKIATNISKLYLASNHQPTSIAAGSILIYSHIYNMNIQKKTISEIFDISIVTIDKIYKKIVPFKKVIISDEITDFVKNKLLNAKYIMVDSVDINILNSDLIEIPDSISEINDDDKLTDTEELYTEELYTYKSINKVNHNIL
jgi:transcription initiation factor TFIIB